MSTPPYARLGVRLNGGAPQYGGITAAHDDILQLVAESTAFWGTPAAVWTIEDYPPGWSGPGDPWVTTTIPQDNGMPSLEVFQYTGNTAPPAFALPPAGPLWGRFMFTLLVQGGVKGGAASSELYDTGTAVDIVGPGGLSVLGFREENQFGGWRRWAGALSAIIRLVDAGIASIPVISSATPQPVGTTGAAGSSGQVSDASHVHALGEGTLRTVANAVTAQVNWNSQRLGAVADPSAAQDVATKTSSEAAATAAAQSEVNWRTASAALSTHPSFNTKRLTAVADPSSAQDVATKTSSEAAATAAAISEANWRTASASLGADPSFNSRKLTSVADPSAAQHAATKASSEAAALAAATNEANIRTALAAASANIAVNSHSFTSCTGLSHTGDVTITAGGDSSNKVRIAIPDDTSASGLLELWSPSLGSWLFLSYDDGAGEVALTTTKDTLSVNASTDLVLVGGTNLFLSAMALAATASLMTFTGVSTFVGNVAYGGSGSYGGGSGVIFLKNATVVPSTNPTGGVILYAEGGALKAKGSSGTVTVIAPA